ncbi:MAG: hypothetical protein A3I88_01705 [Candidatus Portnoybacteria bacterium RIFCSPLOWO2_12_FULL_39_9]|uniref:Uncharacterized protein n=1 Tax=Candidatus Portnoybacteria bacterium RIFCSPHIGHO2_12_FULL_38_9 TaxID=1801997 RepID=A0A1G2FGX9_9BACT|nr:MAG: hypothetical protein A2646_01675 [Candidatus Portnoybacteria bacterium RIFCSPHIGHO2_02_FULL_39_12]OGZ37334.1 MAG: hypothetical protein A3J64_01995 [Candidatus Portnoybacteria bacterium RIFCSPHIGHO2_12_FULL_38_9]OGZ38323.1 MAG: hypothetical protein A3F21_02970 [Candidatus Portnoybacteria bacterium RIFCSPLOWO2_01_FULL_38_39]OGZ39921.1 MAG: hypothetical protein A3I88_01705 [Candidatus Portnoybacteria bacterium RIFCSPLOWO2_12_FULL_39_9]
MKVNENIGNDGRVSELLGCYLMEKASLEKALSNGTTRTKTRRARLEQLEKKLIPEIVKKIMERPE